MKSLTKLLKLFLIFQVVQITTADFKNNNTDAKLSDLFIIAKPFSRAINEVNLGPLCKKHFNAYLSGLENLQIWALKMYDSTGKWPSGILNGNVHQNGDFTQCINIDKHLSDDSDDHIVGKMCQVMGFVEAIDRNSNLDEILRYVHSHNCLRRTIDDAPPVFPTFNELSWSICVPSSCTPADINALINHIISPYNQTTGLDIKIKQLTEDTCETKFKCTNSTDKVVFLAIVSVLILFSVIGYFFETNDFGADSKIVQVFLSFSFKSNFNLMTRTDSTVDDIKCLNGIRTIFALILYVYHKGIYGFFHSIANRTEIVEIMMGPPSLLLGAFWNHVDTFVIMSGLITSYFATLKLKQGKQINIISMYLKRYLRFAPLYIMVVLWMQGFTVPRGSQPMRISDNFFKTCRNKSLWKQFLMIDSIDGVANMCYPPAHQLFTDWQMYLTSPFVMILFYRFQKYAFKTSCIVIFILTLHKFYTIYINRLPVIFYQGLMLNDVIKGMDVVYFNPVYRFIPYLFGLYFGHFLCIFKNFTLTKNQKFFGWFTAFVCMCYALFGPMKLGNKQHDLLTHGIYGCLQPITWAIFICWVVFMCHTGQLPKLDGFLSWKGFTVFSRIAYPFYLLQIITLYWKIASPALLHDLPLIDLNEIAMLIMLSVATTILLLMPCIRLYSVFGNKGSSRIPKNITENGKSK